MKWTNKKIPKLITLYGDFPALWDGRLIEYKHKNKRYDPLLELGSGEPKIDDSVSSLAELHLLHLK